VFTIAAARAKDASGWPRPALALIGGTTLGAIDASEYFGPPGRFTVSDGKLLPVPEQQWRKLRADQQFDAVLYEGPPHATETEPLSATLCAEPGYVEMRLKRIALAGLPPPEVERVKKLCGIRVR
jgi:hypothetical protein